MKKDILVPNIGDFENVEVIEIIAAEGKKLKKNDPIITIESDKSSVEIPTPYVGIVEKIYIKVGDKVSEGTKILSVAISDKEQIINKKDKVDSNDLENNQQIIKKKEEIRQTSNQIIEESKNVLASPKVRKFARELGVDVKTILGSQRLGRVIEVDVKRHVSKKINLNK